MSATATTTMTMMSQHLTATRSGGPPDLLCFDSWEKSPPNASSGAPGVCAVSPTFTDEYGSVKSFEEDQIPNFEPPLTSSWSSSHVVYPSAASNGDYKTSNSTVHVLVSGTHFSVDQHIFAQLQSLSWETSADGAVQNLAASAGLFEIVLEYVLFKTLPHTKSLSTAEKEELETMAQKLELKELAAHVSNPSRASSFLQRRRSTNSQRSNSSIAAAAATVAATVDERQETMEPDEGVGENHYHIMQPNVGRRRLSWQSREASYGSTNSKDRIALPTIKMPSFANRRRTSSTASQVSEMSAASNHSANNKDEGEPSSSPKSSSLRRIFRRDSLNFSSGLEIDDSAAMTKNHDHGESSLPSKNVKEIGVSSSSTGTRKAMFTMPKRLSSKAARETQSKLNHEHLCSSFSDIVN